MKRFENLHRIQQLDPERDHCEIVHIMSGYEFPWDTTRALEIALYRTFCVPSVSALLDKTGEFREHGQKRYDDTALIVAEFMKWGYDSERGREAIRRMNRIHGHFEISNDDYLFVLSTFIFDPLRWYDRFCWRETSQNEKLAMYFFWREVGRRMNIKDIPDSYEKYQQFYYDYQRQNFHFAPTNRAVGNATLNIFLGWFPGILAPLLKPGIYAMLEEPMLTAFGFPHPPKILRGAVAAGLKARGMALRYFPDRRKGGFITDSPQRTYPKGYKFSDFGPSHMLDSLNKSGKS